MKWALAASVLTILLCHGLTARGSVDEAVLRAEADRVAVIAKAREATLAIFTNQGQGGGSGVVISPDGLAIKPRIPESWRICCFEPRAPDSAMM